MDFYWFLPGLKREPEIYSLGTYASRKFWLGSPLTCFMQDIVGSLDRDTYAYEKGNSLRLVIDWMVADLIRSELVFGDGNMYFEHQPLQ